MNNEKTTAGAPASESRFISRATEMAQELNELVATDGENRVVMLLAADLGEPGGSIIQYGGQVINLASLIACAMDERDLKPIFMVAVKAALAKEQAEP